MRKKHAVLAASVISILALAGCSAAPAAPSAPDAVAPTEAAKPLVIAYASDTEANSFVATVTRGMREAAEEAGFSITVVDNMKDPAKAVDNARQVATLMPDVFIEYNSVADSNSRISQIMDEAGVPVLAVQYGVGEAPLYAIDNSEVGALGGQALADAAIDSWGDDVEVSALMLALPQGGVPQLDRRDGAEGVLKDAFGNDLNITEADTKGDGNVARQITADYLTANPSGKVVIWTHNDPVVPGIVAAIRAAGRDDDVLVVGTGGDPVVFPEIRREGSPVVGTIGLFPELWGQDLIKLAIKIAAGEEVEPISRPAKIELIDLSNIDELYPE
jgi:ribose transport system substrate-binding protein